MEKKKFSEIRVSDIISRSGAICHVQIEWLKNKAPESPEAFADLNMKFIENNIEILKKL